MPHAQLSHVASCLSVFGSNVLKDFKEMRDISGKDSKAQEKILKADKKEETEAKKHMKDFKQKVNMKI